MKPGTKNSFNSLSDIITYDDISPEVVSNQLNMRNKGIEDPKSKDQIYIAATDALEAQDFDKASNLFNYFLV